VPYDYHRLLYSFRVASPVKDTGIYRPRHTWTFGGGIAIAGAVGRAAMRRSLHRRVGAPREGWPPACRPRAALVVFTNGVFDLLHPGHVRYLQAARRLGDASSSA
jgi:hypothetical protein